MPSVLWRCWLGSRKGIRPAKNRVVGCWLSVWSKVQTCICPSWCHCHSLSLASVKSRLVLPFWYRLTWVVLEKGPLNGCVCVCGLMRIFISRKFVVADWHGFCYTESISSIYNDTLEIIISFNRHTHRPRYFVCSIRLHLATPVVRPNNDMNLLKYIGSHIWWDMHTVQMIPLQPKTLSPLASFKFRLVLPFPYLLTQVVLEKRPLTGVV